MQVNDGPTRIIVCVTLVPSEVSSVFTSLSRARPELTNRTFLTLSAASFAASRSAILSSMATSSGSRRTGVIHVPTTGADRRQLDLMLLHGTRSLRQRHGFERRLPGAGTAHHARRRKSPTAVDQRSNTDAVRLAVVDAADLALPGCDRLPPVASDPHVRVRRAGGARGVERFFREFQRQRIGAGSGDGLRRSEIDTRASRKRRSGRGRRLDEVASRRTQFFNSDCTPSGSGNSSTTIIIATS